MKNLSNCLISCIGAIFVFQILSIPASAQLQPIGLNGLSFNQDLIAEGAGNDPTTITSRDIGNNFVLFDESFKTNHPIITAGGLPGNGLITNSLDTWQLNSYSSNNALFFAPQSLPSSASITLTTPGKYSRISLLATSVQGPVVVNITLTFSDATSTAFGALVVNNWLGGSPNVIRGFGAIIRSNTVAVQEGTPNDPRLYQINLSLTALDQMKDVTSIDITNTDNTEVATAAFFAVSGIGVAILPITFSSLKGEYKSSENKIDLSWQAEASLISPGFEVERSADGYAFSSIAIVPPQKNAGTSTYLYSDFDLQNRQAWFYRIKETLGGGVINYSRVINVKTSAVASFRISQSGGYLHLVTTRPEKSYMYKITDLRGRELKSGTVSSFNQYSIDIRNLPPGAYVINFLDQATTRALRFVK